MGPTRQEQPSKVKHPDSFAAVMLRFAGLLGVVTWTKWTTCVCLSSFVYLADSSCQVRSGSFVCFNNPLWCSGPALSPSLDSCFVLFCLVVCFIEWQATLQQHTAILSKKCFCACFSAVCQIKPEPQTPHSPKAHNNYIDFTKWIHLKRSREKQSKTKKNTQRMCVCEIPERKLRVPWWRMLQD